MEWALLEAKGQNDKTFTGRIKREGERTESNEVNSVQTSGLTGSRQVLIGYDRFGPKVGANLTVQRRK